MVRLLGPLALAAGLVAGAITHAEAAATDWVGDQHAAVRLITATDSIAAGKADLRVGLEFRFAPGWHGYWRTPGDAGIAPTFDWMGSAIVGSPVVGWPAPTRLVVEGLQNLVYTGSVVVPVGLSLKAPGQPADLHVGVTYAACSNVCVPFQAELALRLPAGPGGSAPEETLIKQAQNHVPGAPAAAGLDVLATRLETASNGRTLTAELRSDGTPFIRPDLFVEGAGDGVPAAPEVMLSNGGRAARLVVQLPATSVSRSPLILTFADGDRTAEIAMPPEVPASPPPLRLLSVLALALLGGFILNLMPCVLPVLSIKLLGLIRHGGASRHAIRRGFGATGLGILASFGALGAVLSGLKLSGTSVGWGIQFQQPWFLAVMATLTVLFAASFFEWLPIGLPSRMMQWSGPTDRAPLTEAFMTGVLATLLATPCSAPFVGTAVGFALAQGPGEIMATFLCLGLGMALPYWAGALAPGLVGWLPRPGAWMLGLRRVLGLLLLGTAAWLLIVLQSVAGDRVALATAVLLVGLLAWRAWISLSERHQAARLSGRVTAALAIGPLALSLCAFADPAPGILQQTGWVAFDADALAGLVAQGKTVLVDVTATWCLTCKVNELAAIERPEVTARLSRPDVIRMRADWSRPDPKIAAYLQRFGRYGIPFDIVYGPGETNGEALPELLTPGLVIDALNAAEAIPAPTTVSDP